MLTSVGQTTRRVGLPWIQYAAVLPVAAKVVLAAAICLLVVCLVALAFPYIVKLRDAMARYCQRFSCRCQCRGAMPAAEAVGACGHAGD